MLFLAGLTTAFLFYFARKRLQTLAELEQLKNSGRPWSQIPTRPREVVQLRLYTTGIKTGMSRRNIKACCRALSIADFTRPGAVPPVTS